METQGSSAEPARPIPPALVWSAGACASVFGAFVLMPAGFVVAGLARPGPASPAVRLSIGLMLFAGVTHPAAWVGETARTVSIAVGLTAGVGLLATTTVLAVLLVKGARVDSPGAVAGPGRGVRALAVAAPGIALVALAGLALIVPIPARPVEWWFLAAGLASSTAWVAARRPRAWPSAAVLGAAPAAAIAMEAAASRGASLASAGGWLAATAAAAAAVGSAAAVAQAAGSEREGAARARDKAQRRARPGHAASLLAACALALVVIAASTGPAWGDPARILPAATHGARAVVVVPHIDDESAFAGDVIEWLAAHGYRVTVVVATDSRGGRALDKDRGYRRARDTALAAALAHLGASDSMVFEDVRDGARITSAQMRRAIGRALRASGLLTPGTVLVTVSGTGHPNHAATFDAVRSAAAEAGLRLYVVWGYDPGHDLLSRPTVGAAATFDAGPAASAAKARAVDEYLALYEDGYSFTLPRVLVLERGAGDVVSVIAPTGGRGASP